MLTPIPVLIPTTLGTNTAADTGYHLDGELAPVLTVDVSRRSVFFEQHILFWKHPDVHISLKPMSGMLKRFVAGRTDVHPSGEWTRVHRLQPECRRPYRANPPFSGTDHARPSSPIPGGDRQCGLRIRDGIGLTQQDHGGNRGLP